MTEVRQSPSECDPTNIIELTQHVSNTDWSEKKQSLDIKIRMSTYRAGLPKNRNPQNLRNLSIHLCQMLTSLSEIFNKAEFLLLR